MNNGKINEKGGRVSTESENETKASGIQLVLSDYKYWWKCSGHGGIISIICPICKEQHELKKSLLNSKAANNLGNPVFTGLHRDQINPAIITLSRLLAIMGAVIIGSLIASLFGSPPFVYAIISVILIPVLWPITAWVFVRIFPVKRIPVWAYKCHTCGEKIVVASDGMSADVGSKKADERLTDELRVDAILEGLKSKDWRVRENAAKAFGEKKDVRGVEPLIQALMDKNVLVRREAAKALGNIGDTRGVEPLSQWLNDRSSIVRDAVKEALHKLGPTDSVIKDLSDKNWQVRLNAAQTLGERKEVRGVEPLIQALNDKDLWLRQVAARALGKIGDRRGVEPLIQLAREDKSIGVRQSSILALGAIGDTTAKNLILELTEDKKRPIRDAAKQALKKCEPMENEIKNMKTEPEEREIKYSCPSCGALVAKASRECPSCGKTLEW
jgi:rubrerythrin